MTKKHTFQNPAHIKFLGIKYISSCYYLSCTLLFSSNLKVFFMLLTWLHLCKTKKRPQVVFNSSWDLAVIWSLIYVKGFFCTVLFSLREHLQTRGHRRVFEQRGINVAAASGETTVLGLSATFKWHEKLNSCPSLAKRSLDVSVQTPETMHKVLARDDEFIFFQNLPQTDTAGRVCTAEHLAWQQCFFTECVSDSCTYALWVP